MTFRRVTEFLLTAHCSLLTAPLWARAQVKLVQPKPVWGTMNDFILTLINIVVTIGLGAAATWFVFCAFRLVAARANNEELVEAKRKFIWALGILAGLLALTLAWNGIRGTWYALGLNDAGSINQGNWTGAN